MKFLILLFLFIGAFVSSSMANPVACVNTYKSFKASSSFESRLEFFLDKKTGYLPLLISDFLQQDFKDFLDYYKYQVLLAERKGDKSPLKSNLELLETVIATLDTKIQKIESLHEPKLIQKIFSSTKSRKLKLDKAVNEANQCKATFNKCSLSLDVAIQEAGNNIILLETLKSNLENYSREISDFNSTLVEQGGSGKLAKYSSESSPFLIQHYERVVGILEVVKSLLQMEVNNVISAKLKLNMEVPTLEQKFKNLIHKGIEDLLIEGDKERSKDLSPKSNGTIPEKLNRKINIGERVYVLTDNNSDVYMATVVAKNESGEYMVESKKHGIVKKNRNKIAIDDYGLSYEGIKIGMRVVAIRDDRSNQYFSSVLGILPSGVFIIEGPGRGTLTDKIRSLIYVAE